MGAGRSMRSANPLAVRRTPLSPLRVLFHNPLGTPKAMSQGCGMQWKLSLGEFQRVQNRRRQPTRSCHFQCDLVVWDFAQQSE